MYFGPMDSDDFRRRRFLREWTGRIDISHLYQLEAIAGDMQRIYQETADQRLEYWADMILKIIAAVREDMAGYQLDRYELTGRELLDAVEAEEDLPKILIKNRKEESD